MYIKSLYCIEMAGRTVMKKVEAARHVTSMV